jgi:hypothetical protein
MLQVGGGGEEEEEDLYDCRVNKTEVSLSR